MKNWRAPKDSALGSRAQPAESDLSAKNQELAHELEVHRIELEMQNESLRDAQEALEESHDRYVDLYEFAPVGYLTLLRSGAMTAINLTGAGLLATDRKEILGSGFETFVHPDSIDAWRAHAATAWRCGEREQCELTLCRRDGSKFTARLDSQVNRRTEPPTLRIALTDISERRQVELALKESEQRFRVMADSAPVLIWMAGPDKGCTWFNRGWLDFTGRSMAQEVGRGWLDGVHPDDRPRCLRDYSAAFDRRQKFELEYRLRRADGEYRWLLDAGLPRFGAAGEFLGYMGSCYDVTRLKRLESDLNHAQAVGHIGSWRYHAARNEFSGSAETQAIFGFPGNQPLAYDDFLARVHPDDRAEVDHTWKTALADPSGGSGESEYRLLVDGKVKWVRIKGEREFDAAGQLCGAFGIVQDTTEIKLARLALLASKQHFRAFMTHGPAVSWIVDADGRFVFASPGCFDLFRVASVGVEGRQVREVFPPELAEEFLRLDQEALRASAPVQSIVAGRRADGSEGEFLVIRFATPDAAGKPLACGTALDVTEERRATAELHAAHQRLERLAAAQAAQLRRLADDLTYAEQRERDRLYELLHDDMQPLLVAARLALSSLGAGTTQQDALKIAAETNGLIGQLIEAARSLSRDLNPPLIRERGLTAALESLGRWVTEHYGLVVQVDGAPELAIDDVAMRLVCFRAVRELLLNVVKHADAKRAGVHVTADDNELCIVVDDDGCGFTPGNTGGTGLGEIRRRLGVLGGGLHLDTRPGAGCVATLTLPLGAAGAALQATG